MLDLKCKYQERAKELSYEQFNKGFYDLTEEQQYRIFLQAEEYVHDELYDEADILRKEIDFNN
jgi:hypothetical protein